jgi:2'-5' RNA ligase
MSRAAQTLRPFNLHLRGITGHATEYLFLNVKSGNDQLYTGLLAPYLTLQETYLPHLTVGRLSSEMAFAEALRQAQSVTASFEIEVHEMIAYRLERENSGNVECSVRLSGA